MLISIFKTTLQEKDPLKWLQDALGVHPDILQWNIDFEDRDNILRVVSTAPVASEIIQIVTQFGHVCIEL